MNLSQEIKDNEDYDKLLDSLYDLQNTNNISTY